MGRAKRAVKATGIDDVINRAKPMLPALFRELRHFLWAGVRVPSIGLALSFACFSDLCRALLRFANAFSAPGKSNAKPSRLTFEF